MHKTLAIAVPVALISSAAHAQYTVHLDPGLQRSASGGFSATIDDMMGDTRANDFFTVDFVFAQPMRVQLVDGASDMALYANFRMYTESTVSGTSPVHAKNRWSAGGALGSPDFFDTDMMRGRFMGFSGSGLLWGGSFNADDSLIDGYTFDTLRLVVKLPERGVLRLAHGKLDLGITGSPESGFVVVPAPATVLALAGVCAVRRRR